MDWCLDCVLIGFSEHPAITPAGIVGLSSFGEVLDGLLTAVLVDSVSLLPVALFLVLLLVALSSSSEEISTTNWADIMG